MPKSSQATGDVADQASIQPSCVMVMEEALEPLALPSRR